EENTPSSIYLHRGAKLSTAHHPSGRLPSGYLPSGYLPSGYLPSPGRPASERLASERPSAPSVSLPHTTTISKRSPQSHGSTAIRQERARTTILLVIGKPLRTHGTSLVDERSHHPSVGAQVLRSRCSTRHVSMMSPAVFFFAHQSTTVPWLMN